MSGLPPDLLSRNSNITSNPPGTRELVFCHQCQNEWYRDEHGLVCPACNSDFTEILENNLSDPRHIHEEEDEEEEEDEGGEAEGPNPHFVMMGGNGPSIVFSSTTSYNDGNGPPRVETRTFRSGGNSPVPPQRNPQNPPGSPGGDEVVNMFSNILQAIIGNNGMPQQQQQQQQQRNNGQQGQQQNPNMFLHDLGQGRSVPVGTFPFAGMQGPNSPNPQQAAGQPPRPGTFFSASFGGVPVNVGGSGVQSRVYTIGPGMPPQMHHHDHDQQHMHDHGPPDLVHILSHLFGPDQNGMQGLLRALGVQNGAQGDYAWSQGDMDRILTELMEQHQGSRPPPASEEVINSIPKIKISQKEVNDDSECVVCRDKFELDEEAVQLPCKHMYHFECVKKWLETNDSCPICRHPVTPEDKRTEQQQQQQQNNQNNTRGFMSGFNIFGGGSGNNGGNGGGSSGNEQYPRSRQI